MRIFVCFRKFADYFYLLSVCKTISVFNVFFAYKIVTDRAVFAFYFSVEIRIDIVTHVRTAERNTVTFDVTVVNFIFVFVCDTVPSVALRVDIIFCKRHYGARRIYGKREIVYFGRRQGRIFSYGSSFRDVCFCRFFVCVLLGVAQRFDVHETFEGFFAAAVFGNRITEIRVFV